MTKLDAPLVVVIPGDLHLTRPDLENSRVAHRVVREINDLIRPDFVQFIGDNVQDASEAQFCLFDEIRGRLDVPHFALVGDHDVKDDPEAAAFRSHVGDPHGAHSLRGFRFIRLNTQEARPLGLSGVQIDWFRNEVDSALAEGQQVLVFQHNYPYQIWENFSGPGVNDWRAIVNTRRVEAIICGHTHYWQIANDGWNVAVATRSIGDPEGGPPGYTLLFLHDNDLAVTYREIDDHTPVVLITHPRARILATKPCHIVTSDDEVRARVWCYNPIASLRYRIDDGAFSEMEPSGEGAWCGALKCNRLSKGEHSLEVIASTSEGCIATQRIEFMVDKTGRYTAVPEAKPAVNSTAFC